MAQKKVFMVLFSEDVPENITSSAKNERVVVVLSYLHVRVCFKVIVWKLLHESFKTSRIWILLFFCQMLQESNLPKHHHICGFSVLWQK